MEVREKGCKYSMYDTSWVVQYRRFSRARKQLLTVKSLSFDQIYVSLVLYTCEHIKQVQLVVTNTCCACDLKVGGGKGVKYDKCNVVLRPTIEV